MPDETLKEIPGSMWKMLAALDMPQGVPHTVTCIGDEIIIEKQDVPSHACRIVELESCLREAMTKYEDGGQFYRRCRRALGLMCQCPNCQTSTVRGLCVLCEAKGCACGEC